MEKEDFLEEPGYVYEQWCEENAVGLGIYLAETGADRELDYDAEKECERIYNDPKLKLIVEQNS